jgi:hypothetical protein
MQIGEIIILNSSSKYAICARNHRAELDVIATCTGQMGISTWHTTRHPTRRRRTMMMARDESSPSPSNERSGGR